VMSSDNVEAIRKATDQLSQELQQVGAAAYQQGGPQAGAPGEGPQPGGPGGPDGPGGDEEVVDGEFRNA
jgi:molecular chaperone DnaK